MIEGHLPVTQALLGTLLTWGLTAAGSAMVIFLRGNQVNLIFNFFVISDLWIESYHLSMMCTQVQTRFNVFFVIAVLIGYFC